MLNTPRIGILCDKQSQTRALQHMLIRRGILVDVLENLESAAAYCDGVEPMALILELNEEIPAGMQMISDIRTNGCTSLLIVSAITTDPLVQVNCLSRGADDYLAHPASTDELMQRLELLLRQHNRHPFQINVVDSLDALSKALTPTELRILETLRDAAPAPLSREQINWQVRKQALAPDDRTIDVYVSHIRSKLRLLDTELTIQTVRGTGFRAVQSGSHC